MLIEILNGSWGVTVPAKLNLFLEVLGKRPDGYHSLQTVMSSVSLTDELVFSECPDNEISLKIGPLEAQSFRKLSDTDSAWDIPEDNRNLICRALYALRARLGITRGMDVLLRKSIPALAGLGGGSADAAATILGGMLAWTGRYDHPMAIDLASNLGSDINFFLETAFAGNSLAICTGRGEIVDPIYGEGLFHFVIVHPPMGCSTKAVFDHLDTQEFKSLPIRSANDTIQAVKEGDFEKLGSSLWNRLTSPAMGLNPWLKDIDSLLRLVPSVLGYSLSGSGSAMFAVVTNREQGENLVRQLTHKDLYRAYYVATWRSDKIVDQLAVLR